VSAVLEGQGFRIRRATEDDLGFMADLAAHDEVEPYMAAVSARNREELAEEVRRSDEEPDLHGRFVVEVEGLPAGVIAFDVANRRSRIAYLHAIMLDPAYRGRGLATAATQLLVRHLVFDLDFHRVQLEVYGFNEHALRHFERAGFRREGVRRQAYWRHGGWMDGILFGLVREDLAPAPGTLRGVPESPEGIDWTLVGGGGQTLRLESGHASGSGGCNRFAGGYRLEDDRLTFEPLASTRMACAPEIVQAETEFFTALGRCARAAVADGELVLVDEDGAELLRFTSRIPRMATFLHTMVRVTDPERSRAFYEALGFEFSRDLEIVRDGELEATNYFFSLGDQDGVLELTYNHDGRSYEMGTGYGHIAIGVDDLDATLAGLAEQAIEPERPPYTVREGGSRICFVRDPDGYRVELIER
jgi:lactoylglutathione lyase